MDIQTLLLGILAIAIGAAVCFAGYKFFLFLLPLFGFVAGFWIGSAAIVELFGGGFLVEVTSWVVGVVCGIILAIGSYFFWYIAVVALSGAVGAWLGDAVMSAIGFDGGLLTSSSLWSSDGLRRRGRRPALPEVGGARPDRARRRRRGRQRAAPHPGHHPDRGHPGRSVHGRLERGSVWAIITLVVAVAGFLAQDRSTKDFEIDMTRYRDCSMVPPRYSLRVAPSLSRRRRRGRAPGSMPRRNLRRASPGRRPLRRRVGGRLLAGRL